MYMPRSRFCTVSHFSQAYIQWPMRSESAIPIKAATTRSHATPARLVVSRLVLACRTSRQLHNGFWDATRIFEGDYPAQLTLIEARGMDIVLREPYGQRVNLAQA